MKKLLITVLLIAATVGAQDFTYSTNLFWSLPYWTNIYVGTNGTDQTGDSYHVWAAKINHSFALTALWSTANSNAAASANSMIAQGITTNLQFVDATVIGGVLVGSRTNTLYFTNGLLMNVTQP